MRKLVVGTAVFLWMLGCAGSAKTPVEPGPDEPQTPDASACKSGCSRDQPNCEGWVRLGFDISQSGTVENARVLRSCPGDKFDEAALNAVSKWKYSSKEAGRKNIKVQLDFSPN